MAKLKGGSTIEGNTIWHTGNMGSNSGLDADLLDGHHASYFSVSTHTHSYLPLAGGTLTGDLTVAADLYIGNNGGGDARTFFYDDNSNTWRTLMWDDSANDWRIEDNGGSMRVLWHSGNDGSGSGLDADLLDGHHSATAATANTIALRNASGDLTCRYLNSSYCNMSHSANTHSTDTIFYSSTDNYIRKNDATGFRRSLDIPANWSIKTANYTAVRSDAIFADTSGGAFTITLPSSANLGDTIIVVDKKKTWDTNNLTIARNGLIINSLSEDLVCDVEGCKIKLVYSDATDGWIIQ